MMSSAFQNLFIIIFMLLSLHSSHILIVDSSLVSETKVQSTKMQIGKVSGKDHENEALLLKNFRLLLGLQSFETRKHNAHVSPSPSPVIEPQSPALATPLPPFHGHSSSSQLLDGSGKGRVEKTLVSVIVSAGVFVGVCVVGLICFCGKFKKKGNKLRSRGNRKSKNVNSQNSLSSSKVTLNPGLDLFYLGTLEMDLEHQQVPAPCTKPDTYATVNTLSNIGSPVHEKEERNKDPVQNQDSRKSETENACNGLCRKEIMTVHECDAGDSSAGEKIIPFDWNSSDEESFHSFTGSCSNVELSYASSGCLSPTLPLSLSSSPKRLPLPQENTNMVSNIPPPPPPPPPHMATRNRIFSQNTKLPSVASISKLKISHPKYSESSVGSNQSPIRDLTSSPRKPSLSPPSIPCPPPFPEGKTKSTDGTPPPPPAQLPQYIPMGKDSQMKLKPLHWDKVRAAPDHSMVWDELKTSSFEVDEEMIESLFGYNTQSKLKNDETKSKSPSPTKHVLEQKRLQNITILLKALNVSCVQVCSALMKGEGLGVEQLEALSKMEPTKEEENKLSGYNGDINKLGSAERFVKALLEIPFAFRRVEAMLYRETFEDEAAHLKNSFSMLEEACKELRSSRLFLKLLEAVLKTGNRMNVGTIRGGAKAFKLDALLKLADVKGTDKKTTLLHFVVKEIIRSEGLRVSDSIMGQINQRGKSAEDKEQDYKRMGLNLVSGLTTELYNVKKTATIDIDVLASSVSNLSVGMSKLKQLVEKDLSGNFAYNMKWFINYAERNLRQLQEDEQRVLTHVKEITEYFHGNLSKEETNPLRIFVIVRDFLGMLDVVCKELRRVKTPTSPNPLAPFR